MDGGSFTAKKGSSRPNSHSSFKSYSQGSSDERIPLRSSIGEEPMGKKKENCTVEIADRGSGLMAVSQSPDGRHLACGGSNVISVLSLGGLTQDGGKITEKARWGSWAGKQLHDVKDVRWHPSSEDYLACSSGGVLTLLNIGAETKKPVVEFEAKSHTRTIWRIAWCQPTGTEQHLLSGSLDGTIRLWDLRGACRSVMTMSKHSQQEKVRDIRVSGAEPHKFAVGLESNHEGAISVWDVRKPDSYILKIKEQTPVHAVDWHPEHPSILASGRAGRPFATGCVKVWDTAEAAEAGGHQPIAKIQTADGVSNVMWRPLYRTHLAVTYMTRLTVCDVWDLPQWWIPLASACGHSEPVTDIVWHDAHVLERPDQNSDDCMWLLSCSKDGTVQRQHLENAYLPLSHMRNACFSQDPEGGSLSSYCALDRDTELLRIKRPVPRNMAREHSVLNAFPCRAVGKPVGRLSSCESTGHGGAHSEGPDSHAQVEKHAAADDVGRMRLLAQRVRGGHFNGAVLDVCLAHQHACTAVGDFDRATTWSLIATLCAAPPESAAPIEDPPPEDASAAQARAGSGSVKGGAPLTIARVPDLAAGVLVHVLRHAAANGDVQTPAHLALAFGRDAVLALGVSFAEQLSWIEGYLSLLDVLGLYSPAAAVRAACSKGVTFFDEKDPFHQIAMRSKRNTTLRIKYGAHPSSLPLPLQPSPILQPAAPSSPDTHPPPLERLSLAATTAAVATAAVAAVHASSHLPPSPAAPPAPGSGGGVDAAAARLGSAASSAAGSTAAGPPFGSPTRGDAPMRRGSGTTGGASFAREPPGGLGASGGESKGLLLCSVCGSIDKGKEPSCAECRRSFVKCALCRVAVRGAYMWCQGCGHGGHLSHMSSWFERYADCPTGCGHRCNVKTDRTMTW